MKTLRQRQKRARYRARKASLPKKKLVGNLFASATFVPRTHRNCDERKAGREVNPNLVIRFGQWVQKGHRAEGLIMRSLAGFRLKLRKNKQGTKPRFGKGPTFVSHLEDVEWDDINRAIANMGNSIEDCERVEAWALAFHWYQQRTKPNKK